MKRLLLILLFVSGIANAQPPIMSPSPYQFCDNDNDGFSTFDLHSKDFEILGTLDPAGYSVAYFETHADAQNNVNAVSSFYSNVSNPQILYVRVTDLANLSSFSLTTLQLQVLLGPVVFPASLAICDGIENDGFGMFDLTSANMDVSAGAPNVTVTYHETNTDATYGNNPLSGTYTNITPSTQIVYARVTNNSTGCASVTEVELHVNPVPTANQPPNMIVYENPSDGGASFDLYGQRDYIIGGQPNTYVQFFLSQTDAMAQVNAILPSGNGCYFNLVSPQTIWATITSYPTGCFNLTSFTLTVSEGTNPNPVVAIPDANFKAKLLAADTTNSIARNGCFQPMKIDTNNDGQIQTDEALRVITMNVNASNIGSLDGILAFSNLQSLSCIGNQISALDLGGMNMLSDLLCSGNQLTTLDLSNTRVQYLSCANNQLIWINIKNNHDLAFPAEGPPVWSNNPNLTSVCADAFELDTLAMILDFSQLTNVTITSDCSLGMEDHHLVNAVGLYPNPANHIVNVQSPSIIKSVEVFDMQGRKMTVTTAANTDVSIDISGYESGIYFFRIYTESGIAIKKLIKK